MSVYSSETVSHYGCLPYMLEPSWLLALGLEPLSGCMFRVGAIRLHESCLVVSSTLLVGYGNRNCLSAAVLCSAQQRRKPCMVAKCSLPHFCNHKVATMLEHTCIAVHLCKAIAEQWL